MSMYYFNQEIVDMHFIYSCFNENASAARDLYMKKFKSSFSYIA
jgi:hypothetical protein